MGLFSLAARLRLVSLCLCLVVFGASAVSAAPADNHDAQHAAGHDDGLPGLIPKVDTAAWSLLTFVIFVLLLRAFAWKPLQEGLQRRESKIHGDLAEAEAARLKASQMLAEHEQRLAKVHDEVREILAEARRDAEVAKQDIIATANKESDLIRQRAVTDIEQARDAALTELFDVVASNVVDATSKVVGRNLSNEDHDRLVREALGEMNLRRN